MIHLCDPFPTDVYYLGNLDSGGLCLEVRSSTSPRKMRVLTHPIQKYKGFVFMEPLIVDMVQDDPSRRPVMDEVTARFLEIRKRYQHLEVALEDVPQG
jgi:hypothetical protein